MAVAVMWPFSCRGCKSKDSEIAFLRGQFASMRTVYKEPRVAQTPQVDSLNNLAGLAELARRENGPIAEPEYPQTPGYFFRDPVQDFDPTKDDR